ncbi:hypothetical protein [Vibrio barjaei]|uniref:hypothetical protein n=1 Tax=Vibrio barjaei TaxID=1676683 RepID=UPI002284A849|nr:hypothetical protein [Vibrio barjaei]MCY9873838.1 hypothetical protein [Vibrio barjaei]
MINHFKKHQVLIVMRRVFTDDGKVETKAFRVQPVSLRRTSCGSFGKALDRYTYEIEFVGREPMVDCSGKSIAGSKVRARINRQMNPHFKPADFCWQDRNALL